MSAVALVTGAAGGIGRAIVNQLSAEGWHVVATDVRLTDEKTAAGENAVLDVRDENAVEALVADICARHGGVEALVNAAGVLAVGSVADTEVCTWDHLFEVNARGVFVVSRAVGARMAQQAKGSIVTVSSNAGAIPRAAMAAYAASKAAATSITRSLGLELGRHGVRCNVVAPGTTRTPMLEHLGTEESFVRGTPSTFKTGIPLQRIAEPVDIAEAVAFLCSPRARHITLQELFVDGGAAQR